MLFSIYNQFHRSRRNNPNSSDTRQIPQVNDLLLLNNFSHNRARYSHQIRVSHLLALVTKLLDPFHNLLQLLLIRAHSSIRQIRLDTAGSSQLTSSQPPPSPNQLRLYRLKSRRHRRYTTSVNTRLMSESVLTHNSLVRLNRNTS